MVRYLPTLYAHTGNTYIFTGVSEKERVMVTTWLGRFDVHGPIVRMIVEH